jgi:hypothetical protein
MPFGDGKQGKVQVCYVVSCCYGRAPHSLSRGVNCVVGRPKQATMEEGTTPVVCHPEDTRNGDAYEEWRKLLRFALILSVVPLVHQLTLASLCPRTFF